MSSFGVAVLATLGHLPLLGPPAGLLDDYNFCQDEGYQLSPDDQAWCGLVERPHETCPALPQACENEPAPPVSGGGSCPLGPRTGDGSGEGTGNGNGNGTSGGGPGGSGRGDNGGSGSGPSGGKPGGREGAGDAPSGGGPAGAGNGPGGPGEPGGPPSGERPAPPEPPDEPVTLPSAMSGFAKVLFFLLLAAGAAWLVWTLLKNRVKDAEEVEEEEDVAKPDAPAASPAARRIVETDVQRLLRLAREAAGRGDFDGGIAHAYAASLRRLEGDGLIEIHSSRTNGDYLRALRPSPALASQLAAITREVERVQFGAAAPTVSLFEEVMARVVPLATRVVLLLLLVGFCGCAPGSRSGDGEPGGGVVPLEGPSGMGAVLALFAGEGIEAKVRFAPLDQVDGSIDALVVFPGGAPDDLEPLLAWVRKGGLLLLAGELPGDPRLGLRSVQTGSAGTELSATGWRPFDFEGMALRVPAGPAVAVSGPLVSPNRPVLVRQGTGDVYAMHADLGDGQVVVFADERLWSNVALSVGDNADALLAMLDGRDRVELCGSWGGSGAATPLESVHNARLTPLIAQLLLLLLLFMVWRGAAFGRLRDPRQVSRRSFSDHVRAVGMQYARGQASQHALGVYASWALERLRDRIPRGRQHDLEGLAAEIAARTGRPEQRVVETLREAAAVTMGHGPASYRGGGVAPTTAKDQVKLIHRLGDLVSALHAPRGSS